MSPFSAIRPPLNGFETMVLTKLDVLDGLDQIPVCVAYKINGTLSDMMPATVRELAQVQPVYEVLPGWLSSTEGISDWDLLPVAAQRYITFLEMQTSVEVGCISTGPERNQTIRARRIKIRGVDAVESFIEWQMSCSPLSRETLLPCRHCPYSIRDFRRGCSGS